MRSIGAACAYALSVVFIVAAATKLRDRDTFRDALETYGWISPRAMGPLSYLVPCVELTCALLLLVPSAYVFAVSVTMLLLFVFTAVILHALVTEREADCGCFGASGSEKVSSASLVRNGVLIVLAGVALLVRSEEATMSLPVAISGMSAGLLLVLTDQAFIQFSSHWISADRLRAVR